MGNLRALNTTTEPLTCNLQSVKTVMKILILNVLTRCLSGKTQQDYHPSLDARTFCNVDENAGDDDDDDLPGLTEQSEVLPNILRIHVSAPRFAAGCLPVL